MTAGTTFRLKRLYRLCPEECSRIREQLTDELSRHPDVLFAYLYGSFVDAEAFHDVDIGVHLSTGQTNGDSATNLSAHLSRTVKFPVDVRILNAAPVSFRLYVLRGKCLFSRDDDLRIDIMEDTTWRYLNNVSQHRHTTKEAFGECLVISLEERAA